MSAYEDEPMAGDDDAAAEDARRSDGPDTTGADTNDSDAVEAEGAEAAAQDEPLPEELPAWAERVFSDTEQIIPLSLSKGGALPEHLAALSERSGEPPRSGILNVDKPAGMTSHDVVKAIRRAARERRVGHAGTLDPMATGVLLVCLGSATRVIEELQAGRKGYAARITLGRATSTYDAEGEITAEADPGGVSRAELEAALEAFRGDIMQVPPMVSALKHKGRRLYDLAREGVEVERPPRPVTVYELELRAYEPPDVILELTVSRGTYIRSIAHDLGEALGVHGHLSALRRTAVGAFGLRDATPLAEVEAAFEEGWWPQVVHPLDMALLDYPALVVDDATERSIRHGQQIDGPAPPGAAPRAKARAYHESGAFIGLLRWDDVTERWQPDRVFPPPAPTEPGPTEPGPSEPAR